MKFRCWIKNKEEGKWQKTIWGLWEQLVQYEYSLYAAAAAAAKLLQSCPTLCDPTDYSPPGSPIPGILQARTLEWVAISSAGYLPDPGFESTSPAFAGRFFSTESPEKPTTNTVII